MKGYVAFEPAFHIAWRLARVSFHFPLMVSYKQFKATGRKYHGYVSVNCPANIITLEEAFLARIL
jgi:hypothetical protein